MRRCTLQIATGHGEKLSGSDLREERAAHRPPAFVRSVIAFAMNLLDDTCLRMNPLPPSPQFYLSRKSFDVASRLLLMRSPTRLVFFFPDEIAE